MDMTKVKDVALISKNELYVIIFYSFAIGLLSLVLPIAAQGLVTIVSFGSLRQPLFVLIFFSFYLTLDSSPIPLVAKHPDRELPAAHLCDQCH